MAKEEINRTTAPDITRMAIDNFSQVACLYRDKFANVSAYHRGLDIFCSEIPTCGQLLELACGPGNMTRYMLDNRPDLNIYSTDLSQEMLDIAREANPEPSFGLLDIRDIKALDKQFDGILCAFGLPYISKEDSIQLIADAAQHLNESGMLYISAMEDDYGKSGIETSSTGRTVYVYYHQHDYLHDALLANGFIIIDTERRDSESGGKKVVELIFIASKSS
ncbi:MAG: class I SAM-dependent methyltransferase [Sphingobacteriales bacterium]|nr:MAG: class I SAM-dependent methyltransferase [Sphingobacteriales bacterium]